MRTRALFKAVACAVLATGIIPAGATNIVWTNTASGDWATAANWNPNQVPSPLDDVSINGAGTVTVDASAAANSLSLGGGTLAGSGSLVLSGTLTWVGGTISGTVQCNGGTVGGGSANTFLNGGQLINTGTLTVATTGIYVFYTGNGSVISNLAGATFDFVTDSGLVQNGTSPTVYNAGLFRKSQGAGTSAIGGIFNNLGMGTVEADSGILSLTSAGNYSGTCAATGTAMLDFPSGTHNFLANSSFSGNGVIRCSGASLNIDGPSTVASSVVFSVTGGTLAGADTLVLAGPLNWTGGTINGAVRCNGGTVGGGSANTFLNGGQLINTGTLTVATTGGYAFYTGNGSVISNLAGATFDFVTDSGLVQNGTSPTVYNAGLFRKSQGAGTSAIGGTFNNLGIGTVEADSGILSLTSAGNYSGTCAATGTAMLDFPSGTHNFLANSSFSGNGVIRCSGASLNIDGPSTVASSVVFSVTGGTLAGADTLVLAGPLNWTGGTINGAVQCNGGTVGGGSANTFLNGGQLINTGTLTVATTGGYAFYTGNGSVISNLAGATFDFVTDSGLVQNGTSPTVYNAGLFRKSQGAGTSAIGGIFNNLGIGTVEADSGILSLTSAGNYSGTCAATGTAMLDFPSGTHNFLANSSFSGNGVIRCSGASLNINGPTIAAQSVGFSLTGGTLAGTDMLVLTGPLNWTGGTITGTVRCNGGVVGGGNTHTILSGGQLINTGTLTISTRPGGYAFYTGNGSVISNLAAATFDFVTDTGLVPYGGAATTYNAGVFRKSEGTGISAIGGTFNNLGTGTVEADSGILSLTSGGLNSGTNAATGNGTLDFGGGAHTLDASSWLAGNGAIGCSAGTVDFSGGSVLTGAVLIDGGTFNFNNAARVTVGAVTVTVGTLGGSGLVVASGPLNWTGGTISGAIQCKGGTVGGGNTHTILSGGHLINSGTLTVSTRPGGYAFYTGYGSVISNLAGATFDFVTDVGTAPYGGSATIYNAGLFRKSVGTGTAAITDVFNNLATGTVEADSGILSLASGGLNSGTNAAVGNATLDFGGGTHTLDANSWLSGNGTIGCSGATVNFSGASVLTGSLLINDGTFNVNSAAPVVVAGVTVTAGTLGGSGLVVASGPLNWTGGTISGAIQCKGGTVGGGNTHTILSGGHLINSGTLTVSTRPGGYAFYTGYGSVISNLAGATFDFVTDVGTAPYGGSATIYNAGLFRKSVGTGTAAITDVFNNLATGTVEADSGILSLASGGLNSGTNAAVGNATLDFGGGTHTLDANSWLAGNGTIGCSGATVNFSGASVLTGSLLINGGTFNVNSAAPVVVAGVTVTAGTLGGSGLVVAGGPLNWTGGTISGSVQCNGGTVGGGNAHTYLIGGHLINSGTLTVSTRPGGYNFYTGYGSVISNRAGATFDFVTDAGTSFYGGTPGSVYNAGLCLKSVGTGTASLADLFYNSGNVETRAGKLEFSRPYVQGGGTTLLMEGTLQADNGFWLNGGTLAGTNVLSGTVTNTGGLVSPGVGDSAPGALTINGNYLQTFGTLNVGVAATNLAGTLTVSGSAALGGTLSVTLSNSYHAALGDTLALVTCGSETGTFTNLSLSGLGTGQAWELFYTPTNVLLEVVSNANTVAQITGSVKDNLGNAVASVSVFAYLTNASQTLYVSASTDAGGRYALNVTNGTWQVGVQGLPAAGFFNVPNQVVVVNGANAAANFVVQPNSSGLLTIAASVNPAGAGTVTGVGKFAAGASVTLSAWPTNLPPYLFVNWTENGLFQSASSNYQFTVTGGRQLVANFALPSYSITLSNYPAAGGTASGGGSFVYGTTNMLSASPSQGYNFGAWLEGTNILGTNTTLAVVAYSNQFIVAWFAEANVAHTVTTATSPGGLAVVTGAGFYTNGQSTVISAPLSVTNPPLAYTFRQFQLNGSWLSGGASFTKTFSTLDPTNLQYVAFYDVVATLPSITNNPQNLTVPIFAQAVFQVGASSSVPLSYQWQWHGTNLAGATDTVLTLNNALPSQAGPYRAIVTDAAGSATSSVATLTVARVLQAGVTNGPTGNLVELPISLLAAGDEAALGFSLDFDPGQLTVAGVVPGSGLSGASFSFDTNQTGHVGVTIDRTSNGGFTLGTQQVARIQFLLGQQPSTNVPPWSDTPVTRSLSDTNANSLLMEFQAGQVAAQLVAPSITQQPVAQTVWAGSNVTFTAAAQGSLPMNFQWQENGTALPGATNATLRVTNVQTSGTYSVLITNAAGPISSAGVLLTVLTPSPDLVVSGVSAPATASAGQPVSVVWQLSNIGNADASAGWWHTVWLAADSAGDGAQFVGALPFTAALPAGQSLSVTGQVVAPFSVVGNRFFMVQADGSNNVVELNKNNNTAVASQATYVIGGDLALQAVSAPGTAQFGQSISVTWVVTNMGSSLPNVSWRDGLYLANSANSLAGATLLLTAAAPTTLAAGGAYTNTQPVTLPVGTQLPAGTYYLTAVADCFNSLVEQTKTNNSMAAPITLSLPPLPDLAVTQITVPNAATPGQAVSLTWGITNQGTAAAASGGWSEAVYLCSQGGAAFNPNQPGSLLATFAFTNDLAAGGFLGRTQQVTLPRLAAAGEFFFVVQADSGHAVVEATTTNNTAEASHATQVAAVLTLSLPVTQVAENTANPALSATVTRNGDRSQPLTVRLSNSGPTHLNVPASVIIGAGQFSMAFQVTVLDDGVVMGDQLVTVGAAAGGYQTGAAQLTVLNTDQAQLTLTPTTNAVLEGQSLSVKVSLGAVTTNAVTVMLYSSGSSRFSAPPSVRIPANASSAVFTVATVDDGIVETPTICTLTATATGFMNASAQVTLNDADTPQVTLTLASHAVSEKAGPQATTGTVTRTPLTPNPVTIELDSSDTNAVQVPSQVTIPANAASVDFPVAAIDDGLVTPPRTNEISGYVLATGTSTRVAAITPDTLVVNDADGASLLLAVAQNTVQEGFDPATTGTVTRNTPATNDLMVSLRSSDPGALVPASVTIAKNQASVAFDVTTVVTTNRGNHTVSLTASVPGYSDGTCAVLVTDTNLADLAVTSVTAPAVALAQSYTNVSYRVANQGFWPVTTNFLTRVYLATDPFGANAVLAGQFEFKGTMQVGEFFDQTLTVFTPQNVGNYWVVVQADPEGNVPEVRRDNNTGVSATPINVVAPYMAWVAADIHTALAGTPVPMHGSATNNLGAPAPYAQVDIHILVQGTERILLAIADANGNFATTFQPLPNEAGAYQIWAAAPGVSTGTAQDSFSLMGMSASPASASLRIAEGSSGSSTVTLQNLSDVPLHGLSAAVGATPTGLSATATLSDATLEGSGTVTLSCTFTAALGATGGVLQVTITSVEGGTVTVAFGVGVDPMRPVLTAYPSSLTAGMVGGLQVMVGFDVVNTGTLASGPITVSLPAASWLQLASANPLAALGPGQTDHVTLILAPAADLQLGPYTGALSLNCNGAGLSVPFSFRCLSDAKGDLVVTSQDDYTYYAAGSPNLAGAAITVLDVYSHAVVTNGVTDTNGLFFAAQLPEGYYEIRATAPGHTSYDSTQLLLAGQTNPVTAFLPLQTVQYIWSVVPTQIPDQTRIVLTTVFDTAVPAPVITVDPAIVHMDDMTNPVNQVNLTIANHGLVAALSAKLNLPTIPGWDLVPLITDLGTLPAESTLVIPLIIRQSAGPQPKAYTPIVDAWGNVWATCLCEDEVEPLLFVSGEKQVPPPPEPFRVPFDPSAFGPGIGNPVGGGGSNQTVQVDSPGNVTESPPTCEECVKGLLAASENCLWSVIPFSGMAKCMADGGKCMYIGLSGQNMVVCTVGTVVSCVSALAGGGSAGTPLKALLCVAGMVSAGAKCIKAVPMPQDLGQQDFASQVPEAVLRKAPAMLPLAERADRLSAYTAVLQEVFGDDSWVLSASGTNFSAWLNAFSTAITASSDGGAHISATEQASLLAMPVPDGLSFTNLTEMIGRWNRTQDYYDVGIYNLADVPAGQSVDFIALDVLSNSIVAMTNAAALNLADGFDDPMIAVAAAYQDVHTQLVAAAQGGGGSVCAQVVLQLDQQAVMSREAFNATLQIINNSTSLLDHVSVEITALTGAQVISTNLFGIAPPTLVNLTAVDGTGVVPAGATGGATWTLVPTVDAAPTNATVYYVSGTLSYTQEGILITVPLTGVPITVHPIPQLYLQYFLERDVYGDDPFTPQVEPSIPFNLAVMVANRGHGIAHNFEITSAQPRIVDNEKGLLINFQLIGAQVNGQNLTPSLTVNFGDINPGTIDIGRWLMISSLQGEFEDYNATFQGSDDFGNKKTAIIQEVAIHEMIHLVQAQGAFEDGKPDFLVNDIPNVGHLPDTLYLSDGTTNPVSALETSTVDSPPSAGHLQVQLTAPMPAGWVYLLVPDPGDGQYTLTRVVRSDGVEIYFGTNVWTTDRTFIGIGRPPVLEHKLHLLDYNSPGGYTLYFTPAPVPDRTPPVSAVSALPANSHALFQVQWSGKDNAGGSGIAYYDVYVSTNGGGFGPWLQQTRTTSALFQGALSNQYAFYCVATDQAGNREAAHATPDAVTTVTLINQPPKLATVPEQFVNSGDTLRLTLSATSSGGSSAGLTYQLGSDAPPAAGLDPAAGVLTWPTSRCARAGTNVFSVIVTDNGIPPLSATGLVTVVIVKSNTAPILSPIANVTMNDGRLLSVTNVATDLDCPASAITFLLGPGAPLGVAITPVSGVLTWTPAAWQAPSTNILSVIATDNGIPPLSATQQFTVVVQQVLADFGLSLGSTNLFPNETNYVPVVFDSGLGLTNLAFEIEPSMARLSQFSLQGISSEVLSSSVQAMASNRWAINLSLNGGLNLLGPRMLGRLTFVAATNDHSALIPVRISQVTGLGGHGQAFTHPATANGLVIVVAKEPVLMAGAPASLIIYGHPGSACGLQFRTNLVAGASWTLWTSIALTNRVVTIPSPLLPARTTFYRAYEVTAGPSLSIQKLGGPVFGLTVQGQTGMGFSLQDAADLASPVAWSNLVTSTLTNSSRVFYWTNTAGRKQFFRTVPQ